MAHLFKVIAVLIILTRCLTGTAQIHTFTEWSPSKLESANTARFEDYLSSIEKEIIKIMNCARIDGKLFARTYLVRYFEIYKIKKTANVASLIQALDSLGSLDPLLPSKGLSYAARDHAYDLGKAGKTGHVGTDGSRMAQRIERYAIWGEVVAENCNYGASDPLDIVCSLLIDEGVASLGHRKNILSLENNYAGVSIAIHTTYKHNCVIDFAGKIISEIKK